MTPTSAPRPAPRSVCRPTFGPAARRGASLGATIALLTGIVLGGCAGLEPGSFRLPGAGGAGPVADDPSPLSADVRAALAVAPMTMHEDIHVQAMRGGRVRLTGSVASSSAASEAVRVAGRVTGVSDVFDTINVR